MSDCRRKWGGLAPAVGRLWFQSSHITSHVGEEKETERVMESERKQRDEESGGPRPKQTAAPLTTHIHGILHVFRVNN